VSAERVRATAAAEGRVLLSEPQNMPFHEMSRADAVALASELLTAAGWRVVVALEAPDRRSGT